MTDSWEDFDLDDNDPSEIPRDSAESGGTNANGKELAWDDEEEVCVLWLNSNWGCA